MSYEEIETWEEYYHYIEGLSYDPISKELTEQSSLYFIESFLYMQEKLGDCPDFFVFPDRNIIPQKVLYLLLRLATENNGNVDSWIYYIDLYDLVEKAINVLTP